MPIKQAALFHALDETTDVHTFIDSKAHIRLAQNLMIKLAVIRLNSTHADMVFHTRGRHWLATLRAESCRHGAILRRVDLEDFRQIHHPAQAYRAQRVSKGPKKIKKSSWRTQRSSTVVRFGAVCMSTPRGTHTLSPKCCYSMPCATSTIKEAKRFQDTNRLFCWCLGSVKPRSEA